MRNDDGVAQRLARDADTYAERAGLTTVRCGLIGSRCTDIHLVPVPVDNGYHQDPRPIDLKYELYLSVDSGRDCPVVELDDCMVLHPSQPHHGIGRPFQWTIFHSDTDKPTVNDLVKSFPGADRLGGPVHGSYLVVKTDEDGVVCDVRQHDVSNIREIILQCFLGRESHLDQTVNTTPKLGDD
ncbi:hypothetical protein EST38_g6349 [Candolleomyces aberdarensis]|uniref:Uncharacterized protein n=1 Tax=Candolleomyces aberdarensis TaxID=2316362 RepID=A0A4Q2DJZ6_9AGAR|nr:hypothetical protein EST38_g6349 [Candolleomyces aberdarensis]